MFSLIIYILIAAIGFMMGVLYKRSYTTAQFFNPAPVKLFRIFLIVFAIAVVITSSLAGWMVYELSISEIPEDGKIQFANVKQVMFFFINFFFLALILLSNIYSQALKRVSFIAYLLTVAFYASFILTDAFIVYDHYFMWQELMNIDVTAIDVAAYHKTGLIKALLGFTVSSFNAVVVWWGMRK
jgi:hypothetical protein